MLGESEITLTELVGKMMKNGYKLPSENELKLIPGIAFSPSENKFKQITDIAS